MSFPGNTHIRYIRLPVKSTQLNGSVKDLYFDTPAKKCVNYITFAGKGVSFAFFNFSIFQEMAFIDTYYAQPARFRMFMLFLKQLYPELTKRYTHIFQNMLQELKGLLLKEANKLLPNPVQYMHTSLANINAYSN